jgi:hypothetical protein
VSAPGRAPRSRPGPDLDEFEIAQAPLALERGERAQNRGEVLARLLGADEEDVALVEQPPLDGPEPRVVDTFVHDEDPLRGHTEVADDVALGRLRDGDQRGRASDPGVVESEEQTVAEIRPVNEDTQAREVEEADEIVHRDGIRAREKASVAGEVVVGKVNEPAGCPQQAHVVKIGDQKPE